MCDKLRAVDGVESAPLENGAVLFNPQSNKFIMLNGSAAFIWGELATPATEEDLADRLCARFSDVEPATALEDARTALATLHQLELVTSADD